MPACTLLALRLARESLLPLAVAATIAGAAFLGPEPNTQMAVSVRDFARFLILALMAFTALRILALLGVGRVVALLGVASAVMAVGLAVEGIEVIRGQEFSSIDVMTNAVACVTGIAAAQWQLAKVGPRSRAASAIVAVLLSVVAAVPFARTLQFYAGRSANFPVLLDASRTADLGWVREMPAPVRIGLVDSALQHVPDEPAFVVSFEQGALPGLAIDEPYGDWSGFNTLVIDLINPGPTPLDLILNVDDMRGSGKPGDRYDERVQLAPRSRRVLRTPLEMMVKAIPHRRFALDDMDIVMIYRLGPAAGEQLLVRRIWLE